MKLSRTYASPVLPATADALTLGDLLTNVVRIKSLKFDARSRVRSISGV